MSLPAGKTRDLALQRAVAMREALWRQNAPEDRKITELQDYCTRLYGGDRSEGERLAVDAIWTPGVAA